MLSCRELAQRHASDHIDHQLTGSFRWSVRLHLLMCSHCRRFMRQLKMVKALLRTHLQEGNTLAVSQVPETEEAGIQEVKIREVAERLWQIHREQP